MSEPVSLYDIVIWLETGDDPAGAARALIEALGEGSLGEAGGVRVSDNGVLVEFPEMKPKPPLKEALQPLELGPRVLPIVQALISLSAARVRAGIAPSQRIVIEVTPSPIHQQDELRHA